MFATFMKITNILKGHFLFRLQNCLVRSKVQNANISHSSDIVQIRCRYKTTYHIRHSVVPIPRHHRNQLHASYILFETYSVNGIQIAPGQIPHVDSIISIFCIKNVGLVVGPMNRINRNCFILFVTKFH